MVRHIVTAFTVFVISGTALYAQDRFLGKNATEWVAQLKSNNDPKQRRNAAFALGKLGNRSLDSLPAMKFAFTQEKDPKVRETLVYAMGEICRDSVGTTNDTDLERIFISATSNQDPHVRRSGAYALGCLANKSRESIQALETLAGDQHAFVRQNAAWALGQFGEAALPTLKKSLRDSNALVKRDAANALLQMKDADKVHELLPELLPLCRDANSETRRAALNVLVRVVDPKDREAIPPLRAALDDRDVENKRNAALALSNIGGDETAAAMPVLLEAIKNGDADLRRQAVAAFRNIGPAAAQVVPKLIDLLRDDKDNELRGYAAFALGGIGKASEPAVPLLVQKIQDTKEAGEIRIQCAMAMARIGPVPAAAKAVPGLLEVLGDPTHDIRVRERVMWALRVHAEDLRNMNGTKDTFTRILGEPLNDGNRMLRYDAAYMLGMIWQKNAPEATLDILTDFLKDDTIKIFDKTVSGVGGASAETNSGKTAVEERGKGDGRIMAADALRMMGPGRYAGRPALMKQLRALAGDPTTYEPLRKKAMALITTK
ncbi:MAG TPA: HEAT repeat domain-containing protein [Gemmataceae bacterium]|nr:HEAT repeat domain-containing protein [Gemmataceae bacterium]